MDLKPLFYKALITAIIFTIFFLVMTHVDMFLQSKGIDGYKKIYMMAPVQFVMILVIYMGVMVGVSLLLKGVKV